MLIQNIALVPDAGGVTPAELLRVSAALQKQVSSHFGPCWGIQASVDPFLELEQIPAGYVPIVLSAPESMARSLEISLDPNGQPFARVSLHASWSLAASRACLELLLNPFGQRTLSATSPRSDQGPAEVLVEACGAFGEMPTAYAVNDVAVSDFCTPAFFRPTSAQGAEPYTFRGSLTAPLTLLRGGHVAWFDPISNSWWLRSFHDEHPSDRSLGPLQARGRSLRELVLRHEPHGAGSALSLEPLDARIRWQWLREQSSAASVARAQRLREKLGLPMGMPRYDEEEDEEETVAMAISPPRSEPVRALRTGASGVIVAARDVHAVSGSALERRDTLPLTQLMAQPSASAPPALPASAPATQASVSSEPRVESTQARSVSVERPVTVERAAAPDRPVSAERSVERVVTSPVSHSSIPPIAMLAEPPRNETSRTGLMVAAAAVAALLTVAIMNAGTRSAAHSTQGSGATRTPALAPAKPAAAKLAADQPPITPPLLPMPPVASKPQPPVAVASVRPPRPAHSAEAEPEREQARERRRQQRERAISEQPVRPEAPPESEGARTATIENLLDTRR